MRILDKIENAAQKLILKSLSTPSIYNALSNRLGDKISIQIVPKANPRSREDITTWINALKLAENVETPMRSKLYYLYEVVDIDGHISSLTGKRQLRIKGSKFKIVDPSGKTDEQAAKLFEAPWFHDFLDLAMESIWQGHSLIQFNDLVDREFDSVELIRRHNVRPETGEYLVNESDSKGIVYRDSNLMDWYIEVGKPKNLGLFKKAAPMALWKKNAMAQWAQYGEMFGMPFRTIKTPGRDNARLNTLEAIAQEMGSAGWAILQDDETIEIVANAGTDAFQVFDKLVDRCNTEASKLILHQTMTTDNGSSRSQADVHQDVAEEVHMADKTFIQFTINKKLIPLMIKHGYKLQNRSFAWDDSKTLPIEERIKIDSQLLQHYDIDAKYITDTYNVPVTIKDKPAQEIEDALGEAADKNKKPAPGKKKVQLTADMIKISNYMHELSCPACGGVKVEMAFAGRTEREMEDLFLRIGQAIHNDDPTTDIHDELYFAYADLLSNGIKQGYGVDLYAADYNTPDNQMQAYMRANVHVFSGAKSLQAIREMRKMLQDETGKVKSWSAFKNNVLEINQTYNTVWLKAEYDLAISSSQMAAQWQRIEAQKSQFPYLQYRTAGDARVSEEHRAFDGMIVPVDDPFWNTHYPPLRFNCRCDVNQVASADPSKVLSGDAAGKRAKGISIPKMFKRNVGKDGVIFSSDHPYLEGQEVNKWLAESTYGLKSIEEINDRLPSDRQPTFMRDGADWVQEYKEIMKKHQVGDSDTYSLKTKTGDVVAFKPSFLKHMQEQKQLQEERWKLFPEIEKTLLQPDEVWATSTNYNRMDEFNTVYIRYYNGSAIVVATKSTAGSRGEILAKTIYQADTTNRSTSLNNSRKGVLMYRK